MTTRFITVHEFSRTASKLAGRAKKQKEQVILQSKNEFFFKLTPLTKKEIAMEKFAQEIREAEESVRAGRVYSHEQVKKMFHIE